MLCELSLHHLQFGFQRKIFFFSLKNSSNHLQDLFSLAASNLWSWATSKMKMLFKHESESEVAQSCPTLCDPMDCSLPAPPSMEFSRQESWNMLPFPSPGDLSNPEIEPRSPAVQADTLPSETPGK